MWSYKIISVWAVALNVAVNWRGKLAAEKLHCADVVHNPPIIHSRDAQSRRLPRITAHAQSHGIHGDRDSVIFLQPYRVGQKTGPQSHLLTLVVPFCNIWHFYVVLHCYSLLSG